MIQLATKSGIGKSTLNNIENGKISPTLFQLETMAIALDVKITDLFDSEYKQVYFNIYYHECPGTSRRLISKIMENGLSISAIMANMSYSVDGEGGNHLAKILAKQCSGKLYEVTEKLHIPVFEEEKLEEIKGDILQAGQVKEKIGKGYRYPVIDHMLGLDTEIRGDRRKLLSMAEY